MAICGHKDISPTCPSKDEPMGEKIFAQFLELDVALIAGGTKYEFAACLQGESSTTTHHSPCGHDPLRATSVLFAQLAFWLDKARRLVDSLKRPSAMAEHAKLGVRLNRMGCEDGRKILENPYTSDNNPRYWKNTLCDLCASQVALDLFHGPVIFLLDNLFCG